MMARSVGLGAMFGWVLDALRFIGKRPGTALGAAALSILWGFVIALPIYALMFFAMRGHDGGLAGMSAGAGALAVPGMLGKMAAAYGLTLLLALVLHPPVTAGWIRLCAAIDQGRPASALDIFAPFREPATWLRTVLYAILGGVLFVVVLALLVLAFRDVFMGVFQMFAASFTGAKPEFPGGVFLASFVSVVVLFALQFVFMVGFGEVAMRDTSPVAALGGAFATVGRNLHKLLLFSLCVGFVMLVVMLLLGLLLALVVGVLVALSPSMANVVVFALEIPLALLLYPVVYAGMYYVWKSMLGGDAAPAPPVAADADAVLGA
jgi:hypothetical protein